MHSEDAKGGMHSEEAKGGMCTAKKPRVEREQWITSDEAGVVYGSIQLSRPMDSIPRLRPRKEALSRPRIPVGEKWKRKEKILSALRAIVLCLILF